jgi:transposase
MTITAFKNDTTPEAILYMAMELSQNKWSLAFGTGVKARHVVIEANDRLRLLEEIQKAKVKFGLPESSEVMSCYEAGRDGFWLHRFLEKEGVINIVLDSSSIKVDRKARRAKTDRLDAGKLLRQLIHHLRGEEKLQVARVPSEADEDRRRMHRERERLKKERTGHTNRTKSLLALFGIKCKSKGRKTWKEYLETVTDWKGSLLPQYQKEELLREAQRLEVVEQQLKELESSMLEQLKTSDTVVYSQIKQLKSVKGIGDVSSWVLIMEWFGWRKFKNRREVGAAAGLVGTPYDSGESQREQGITKAGNCRIRALMIELSWSWLRYQPDSDLSKWFDERFNHGKRSRKVGIVALARKLLIAIWRYIETGELPKGAQLKTV